MNRLIQARAVSGRTCLTAAAIFSGCWLLALGYTAYMWGEVWATAFWFFTSICLPFALLTPWIYRPTLEAWQRTTQLWFERPDLPRQYVLSLPMLVMYNFCLNGVVVLLLFAGIVFTALFWLILPVAAVVLFRRATRPASPE